MGGHSAGRQQTVAQGFDLCTETKSIDDLEARVGHTSVMSVVHENDIVLPAWDGALEIAKGEGDLGSVGVLAQGLD